MDTKLNPTIQDFRNILYLLGFDAWQENRFIKKLFAPGRKLNLIIEAYGVLCSGQATPTHRETLQKFGL